jgi:hypothetical protein
MSYPLDFNIRERLVRYLANEISLNEFEDWFFSETWDVDQVNNLDLLRLVYGVKLRLAEFSHGDWTEDELRSHLRSFLVEQYVTTTSQPYVQYGTSNMSQYVQPPITHSAAQFVDIKSLAGYV